MDLFGLPLYGARGNLSDHPGYGCHGPTSRPCGMRPSYYPMASSNPFYRESDWYPENSGFPFIRSSQHRSPFDRSHNLFGSMYNSEQPCHHTAARTRAPPDQQAQHQPVVMKKDVAKCGDTMDKSSSDEAQQSPPLTKEIAASEAAEAKAEQIKHNVLPAEIRMIEEIMKNISVELEGRVVAYNGVLHSKEYIYIEESLVAILLQLDKVDANGNQEIRKARKSAVCKIQQLLTNLESKATDKDDDQTVAIDETLCIEQPSTGAIDDDEVSRATTEHYSSVNDDTDELGISNVHHSTVGHEDGTNMDSQVDEQSIELSGGMVKQSAAIRTTCETSPEEY